MTSNISNMHFVASKFYVYVCINTYITLLLYIKVHT